MLFLSRVPHGKPLRESMRMQAMEFRLNISTRRNANPNNVPRCVRRRGREDKGTVCILYRRDKRFIFYGVLLYKFTC